MRLSMHVRGGPAYQAPACESGLGDGDWKRLPFSVPSLDFRGCCEGEGVSPARERASHRYLGGPCLAQRPLASLATAELGIPADSPWS